jgi:hypothetical protein
MGRAFFACCAGGKKNKATKNSYVFHVAIKHTLSILWTVCY